MASILAVEDNPVYAKLYEALLSTLGHTVEVAGDGPTALTRLQSGGVDLVLMDLYLPGMSGTEVTQAIRQNPATAAIPVLAITAATEPDIREQVLAAGCNGVLAKPFKRPELNEAITSLLDD